MPKKTLALICGLVLVTFILFVIALNNNKTNFQAPAAPQQSLQNGSSGIQSTDQSQGIAKQPEVNQASSVLSLSPNPFNIAPGEKGTIPVIIDTSNNEVTAIQLEIAYDPNFITNVKVSAGDLFTNPVVLIDKNRTAEGRYTFAYGITPNHSPIQGVGNAANITFTALNKPGQASQLALLPQTLVTARSISNSVLKSATGTLIEISNPGTGASQ